MKNLIDSLAAGRRLSAAELAALIELEDPAQLDYLQARAVEKRQAVFGTDVYIRGLIELSSYCRNDCYYCGLRRSNAQAERYRLLPEQILACCQKGYQLGFRTFVLQGGEDTWFTEERVAELISRIKADWPDCALTLSLGERPRKIYAAWRKAGADRYLLRHETADARHYGILHPPELSFANRRRCLYDLKELGFQVGAGMMVGAPFQSSRHLAQDLLFLQELQPQMVGIGPFIPHHNTPFARYKAGSSRTTLTLLSLTRLLLPESLLPATTALSTVDDRGRELGILAGANVVMPNLSPPDTRKKYLLYDNKASFGLEAAEEIALLKERVQAIGYQVVVSRGDAPKIRR